MGVREGSVGVVVFNPSDSMPDVKRARHTSGPSLVSYNNLMQVFVWRCV